ncbi:MAG: hypothetical protein LKG38_02455 [Atopobiaceae bacterium]|nr:hypothetical protein [Atopobiaceae bacterium]MCH4119827.1 hypothetical protein [Atopobiaceae bacterium]MCI1318187.1 hypothetical protein [Atopobiaceae bacterium]MCI1389108.1 hypothetical protein [Atopobiaceae bacterium]MCI1432881.1 hypothetical protein [Atopobiaceae bacterium]
MIIEKPEPMQIGGRYYYTLTSYDPVTIEVDKAFITDEDVDEAYANLIESAGGDPATADDAFVREHFDDAESTDEVRAALRQQLNEMNDSFVDSQKMSKCATELAKRLRQSVPADVVASYRDMLLQQLEAELSQQGLTRAQFLQASGSNQSVLDKALTTQATAMAEQNAALDAYADELDVEVADDELADLLGMPKESAEQYLGQAREAGLEEELRRTAIRNKANLMLVKSSTCTVHEETEADALERMRGYRESGLQQRKGAGSDDDGSDKGGHKGFKLV